MTGTHDNRAVWERVNAPDARGLCSALADALGVELHPAGTAAKMQAAEAEVAAPCRPPVSGAIDYDRVREQVPECELLSNDEIDALLASIAFWRMGIDQRNLISDRSSTLTAFDPGTQSYPLTARGREVLAAIDACRVTEAEPESDAEVVRSDQRLLAENAELRRETAENAADKKESLKCIRTLSESISRVRRGRIDYDRVRAEVPECEGLTDGQIDWIANTIRSADILSYEQKASCNKLVRDLTDWNSTAMTARGREVLAAIDACRVTQPEPEPEPEPEPIGYSLRALLGLAWEYAHDARAGSSFLDAARAEGLLVGTYGERKPTDLGRKTWTDFLRRLGLPGDGSKPEPTLTESADGRREWRLNGVLHREDGPAIEWPDGYRSWWLNGVRQPEPDKGGRQ